MADLPFLKAKRMGTALMAKTKPDGSHELDSEDAGSEGLQTAAEDLISAVHRKDSKSVADALRAAFQMLDSEADSLFEDDNASFLSQDDN